MRAHERTFLDLVQGEKQFQIPLYQRTYSWTDKQLRQLWRDILEQGEDMASGSARSGHFIGSVVLAPSPTLQAGGVQRWLVVDGQQRLTTLMLALAALRDHMLAAGDPTNGDRLHRQYLVNEFARGDDLLRLLPTQADRGSYRGLILRTPGAPATGSIGEAYQLFRRAVLAADDPDDDDDINRIEQTIRAGLSIVEITAERGDNVYRIFESLNNTGLQLSQADLLRNYAFMRLPSRGEDVYRDVWLPMQERLTPRDLELLVWLDLVIRGDERVKQTEIYRAQQERFEELLNDEGAVEAELIELARRSRHLARILDPERESDPGIRVRLRHLQAWGAATSYPLVMHLLDLHDRGVTDAADVALALSYIESFLVRRMLCQVPTNNLNRVFNASPAGVGDQAPFAPAVRNYLSGRRRHWPTDDEFRRSIRVRPFYWTGRGPQRSFVLRRLEESFNAAEPVDFALAKLTIEHVLPQTPTPEWLDLLAAEVTDEGGPKELHELLVHTLGNLTLTAENAKLSNGAFQRKQDIYQASALRMNREIADTDSWGKAQIFARAERLGDRAAQLWPGPGEAADDDPTRRDWSLLRLACAALPQGTWTTYGDLAELIGSHPVPVGVHVATQPVENGWRVLTASGSISSSFRWQISGRDEDPQKVLEAEGVSFTDGRADPAQRINAAELAELLGMETDELPAVADSTEGIESEARNLFLIQLTAAHPNAREGIEELLTYWQSLGGRLSFGRASETSCFLMLDAEHYDVESIWPFTVYPTTGTVEVVFQHMRRRAVFAELALREEFRYRLHRAGIFIPEVKLSLRPSFSVGLLRDRSARDAVKDALEWFVITFRARLKQRAAEQVGGA